MDLVSGATSRTQPGLSSVRLLLMGGHDFSLIFSCMVVGDSTKSGATELFSGL